MQWIKASERLPDEHKNIVVRINGYKYISAIVDGYFFINDTAYDIEFIEWLDETESPATDTERTSEITLEVLQQVVKVIRQWHDMNGVLAKVPQHELDFTWEIYFKMSPEMKLIREAFPGPPKMDWIPNHK